MTGGRRSAAAVVGVAAIAVVCLALLAPAATADPHGNGSTPYVIEQDDQCIPVDPIDDPDQSVESFYDYRHPNSTHSAPTYSSHGTTRYQADNTSTLMLYEGAEGTSLVFVHEKLHQPAAEGSLGSSAMFNVTGISPGDGWAVEDDDYDEYGDQDDVFVHNDTYSVMNWVWGEGRTDGGAYRGLGSDTDIGIDPAFNDEANIRFGGQYAGYVHDWTVVTETADGFDRIALNNLYQGVTVRSGHCARPNATLVVDEPAPGVGATVTFDASDSTAAANSTFRWDITGNGTVDRTTETPVVERAYSTPGERNVSVTIVDGHDRTDTASVLVEVGDSTPPTARVDAPANATVGEAITVSAAASTDNHRIDQYAWAFGDGTTIGAGNDSAGPTATHTYDEPGTYEIVLTVTDPSGNDNVTTASVTVTEGAEPLTANVTANRTTADVGAPIRFDASNSTGDIVRYEWTFGDGTAIETGNGTANRTAIHPYDEPGNYTVTLTVHGPLETRNTTTLVNVTAPPDPPEPSPPVANLSAPANATVNETVTLDANASTTGTNASYEWVVDGETVDVTSDATADVVFEEPGDHTVGVVVSDDGGIDTANTTVAVSNSSDGDSGGDGDGDGSDGGGDGDGSDDGGEGDDGNGNGDDSGDGDDGSGGPPAWPPDPDPPEPDEPVETTVAIENGTVLVTATGVDAGDSFDVTVPADASRSFQPVTLRSVEVTAATDAGTLTIAFEPAARAVPGRFAQSVAYVPNATAEIDAVRYEFAVDRRVLRATGIAPANLTVYADGGDWTALDTGLGGETDDRVLVSATVAGETSVGVGAVGPALFVERVETAGPMTNGTIDLVAVVRNTGSRRGEWTLPVEAVGGRVVERSVALGAGEGATVSATVSLGDASAAAVRVGGVRTPVAAVVVRDLGVGSVEPAPNESIGVEAVLVNRGAATAEFEATLVVGDEAVASKRVVIAPGERRTVSFDQRLGAEGTYDLAVANATTTVRVTERDSFDEADAGGSGATDGFGVLVALVAVSLATLGRRRAGG